MSNRLRGRFPNRSSNRVPSWVLTAGGVNASLDIDFVNDLAFNSSTSSIASLLTCTRAAPATTYYTNADRTLTGFSANTLRYGTNGLLVEETRTNLQTRSQEFDNSDWTKSNAAVSANAVAAPDGTLTADKLTENSTSSTFFRAQTNLGISKAASAITYATSVYAKAAERTQIKVGLTDGANGALAYFNLSTGVVISSTGSGGSPFTSISATIEALASGWYRCILICTSSTATALQMNVDLASGGTNVYTGVIGNGVYLWGAQLEAGSFSTSYVVTLAGSVTRSADLVTLVTAKNAWPLTVYAEMYGSTSGGTKYSGIYSEYSTGLVELFVNSSGNAQTDCNGSPTSTATGGAVNATAFSKVAAGFDTNNVRVSVGGALGAADTTVAAPSSTRNTTYIGYEIGGGYYTNGYIGRIAYWPSRVADADLQTLTSYALSESTFDVDFVNNLAYTRSYLGQSTRSSVSISSLLTCTRAQPATTYYTTSTGTLTSFAANALRYGDQGLLVEESRTNLALRSQEFDNAAWAKSNATATADQANAPDGTLTADFFKEDTTNGTHLVGAASNITISNGSVYTFSFYAKANGRNYISAQADGISGFLGGNPSGFDLSLGTATSTAGSTASIVALANGWYRCIIVATASGTTARPYIGLRTTSGTAFETYTGNNTSGVYLWGAQLELGSFVTSYIPHLSSSGTVTRNADQVTLVTAKNAWPLSVYVEGCGNNSNNTKYCAFYSEYSTGFVELYINSSGNITADSNGSPSGYSVGGAVSATTLTKVGGAWDTNNVRSVVSGTLGAADTAVGIPSAVRNVTYLGYDAGGGYYLNGRIGRLCYFPTRIGDTNLQTLTA